jgi:alkylation response protein AidB-like acyl-CoA dehydrogenase
MSDVQSRPAADPAANGASERGGPDEGGRILAAAIAAAPLIRTAAEEIESGRTLPPAVVEAMREAGVFRMSTPRDRGGPELDPMAQFEVIEAIAIDGSAGWCAYINSTSGYFSSLLDQDVARELYPSIDISTGGMPVPVGRAELVEGGYRISGRWSFGSGVMHSGWMVCGCVVSQDGEPLRREDGSPQTVTCFVSSEQFEVIDTWEAMGMRGSGSHDFTVTDLFVPRERTFDQFTSEIRHPGPLYALRTMFLFNHAAVALGIARAAIDEFAEIAVAKKTLWGPLHEQEFARVALARATAIVGAARGYCLETLADVYATLVRGEELGVEQRARYRIALTHAHRAAVEAVDLVFHAAGTTPAVRLPSVLERCFRDVHVANQHIIASPKTFEIAGGMLLGTVPNDPQY